MSKFDDDIARGCLESGEPLEALYGTGWWTKKDEPEPDPVDLYIASLESRIAELEATQRWIPVGEKPLEAGTFLVLLKDGDIKTDWTFLDGGRYYWWNSGDAVTHWMPRPKLPKERER